MAMTKTWKRILAVLVAIGAVVLAGCVVLALWVLSILNPSYPDVAETTDLMSAREAFDTTILHDVVISDGPADVPPPEDFFLTKYAAEDGMLAAYLSPDPGDGERHPAIIWAHGGFGGIGSWLWENAPRSNDQSVRAFLDAGVVTMCPSWRGECDNPGQFELFYGEVNDLLAAERFLRTVPYVDPDRIYLAGHSTGGTLALLAAVSPNRFRAIFSFGGAPELWLMVRIGGGYGNTPFNHRDFEESFYRSPTNFCGAITTPTYYFEGEDSAYCDDAVLMREIARPYGVPFFPYIIENGTHFNILQPFTRVIAEKILADEALDGLIVFSEADLALN